MTVAYGIMLAVAAGLFAVYFTLVRKKEPWLIVLYVSVCITELGYLLVSVSGSVPFALFATKITYLGHILALNSMLLTSVKACGFRLGAVFKSVMLSAGAVVFAVICTAGYQPWYYKSVSLETADSAVKLVKEYGPLHNAYFIYVLITFSIMIGAIAASIAKKKVPSNKHAGLLIALVTCNIAMWIIEKFVTEDFEFLSLSYILSEGMLFFLYWMMQDYILAKDLPKTEKTPIIVVQDMARAEKIEKILSHLPDGVTLSSRQTDILEGIIDGKSRKVIASDLHISENTVKMHTASLYRLLDVSSRDEIHALMNK